MGNPGTRYYILMSRVPKYCGSPGGTEPNRVYRTVRYNSENRCIPSTYVHVDGAHVFSSHRVRQLGLEVQLQKAES